MTVMNKKKKRQDVMGAGLAGGAVGMATHYRQTKRR